jgi:hypothetical protein
MDVVVVSAIRDLPSARLARLARCRMIGITSVFKGNVKREREV